MVKPLGIVSLYIDFPAGILYADRGEANLEVAGFVISSGIVIDGGLTT